MLFVMAVVLLDALYGCLAGHYSRDDIPALLALLLAVLFITFKLGLLRKRAR